MLTIITKKVLVEQITSVDHSLPDSPVKAVIFDLDGTLLNTFPDLVALTNAVLDEFGYPVRTPDEIRSFIGDGILTLMRRSMPAEATEEQCEAALAVWRARYLALNHDATVPYEGIAELVANLKTAGIKTGVLSNKFDAGTKRVIELKFPGMFDAIHGESPDFPRKPNPEGLLKTIQELGAEPDQVMYVGDSGGDMKVAKAAGAFAIGVSWGYRTVDVLREAGADVIVSTAQEILELVKAQAGAC